MLRLMKLHRLMSEESGDDVSSSGGSSAPESSSPSETPTPSGTEVPPSSDSGGDEPKTMLEAIEQGLSKDEKKPAADQKPSAQQQQGKPADKKDEVAGQDEQMPEGLSVKARERFQTLTAKLKEYENQVSAVSKELEQAQVYSNTLQSFVQSTGTNPEQMTQVAAYLRATNSGDLQTEYNILTSRLREIQMETGQTFENLEQSVDPLSAFPDLADAVASYQVTRQHAMEIARARMQQQQQQQQQQQVAARNSDAQTWNRGKDSAVGALKQWELQMAASDPDYAAVAPLLQQNTEAIQWIVKNAPPRDWQHHMTLLYNQTKAARQTFGAPRGNGPRPLSGSGAKPANAGKAPGSMFEAMFPEG